MSWSGFCAIFRKCNITQKGRLIFADPSTHSQLINRSKHPKNNRKEKMEDTASEASYVPMRIASPLKLQTPVKQRRPEVDPLQTPRNQIMRPFNPDRRSIRPPVSVAMTEQSAFDKSAYTITPVKAAPLPEVEVDTRSKSRDTLSTRNARSTRQASQPISMFAQSLLQKSAKGRSGSRRKALSQPTSRTTSSQSLQPMQSRVMSSRAVSVVPPTPPSPASPTPEETVVSSETLDDFFFGAGQGQGQDVETPLQTACTRTSATMSRKRKSTEGVRTGRASKKQRVEYYSDDDSLDATHGHTAQYLPTETCDVSTFSSGTLTTTPTTGTKGPLTNITNLTKRTDMKKSAPSVTNNTVSGKQSSLAAVAGGSTHINDTNASMSRAASGFIPSPSMMGLHDWDTLQTPATCQSNATCSSFDSEDEDDSLSVAAQASPNAPNPETVCPSELSCPPPPMGAKSATATATSLGGRVNSFLPSPSVLGLSPQVHDDRSATTNAFQRERSMSMYSAGFDDNTPAAYTPMGSSVAGTRGGSRALVTPAAKKHRKEGQEAFDQTEKLLAGVGLGTYKAPSTTAGKSNSLRAASLASMKSSLTNSSTNSSVNPAMLVAFTPLKPNAPMSGPTGAFRSLSQKMTQEEEQTWEQQSEQWVAGFNQYIAEIDAMEL